MINVLVSARPSAWTSPVPTGRILMKVDFFLYFFKICRKN